MHKYIIILLILFPLPFFCSRAETESPADKAYKAKDYVEALRLYTGMEKKGWISADILYNIGNCYYRQNNYPKAVLFYCRVIRIDPSNSDAQFNLELCKARIGGNFNKQPEMFFISWTRDLVKSRSANQWGIYGIASFSIFLLSALFYIFAKNIRYKRIFLGFSIVSLFTTIAFQSSALYQSLSYKNEVKAVVMNATSLNIDINNGKTNNVTLIPGIIVDILDESPDGTIQVALPDGRIGWTKATNLEKV